MQITANAWNEYITRLSRLNRKAGQLMREYIGSHGTENTADLIAYAYGLVTKYGEGSAELACQMYDALAEAANAGVPAAEPAIPADYGEVARMVNATKDQNPANLPNGVSRLVKRAGADTTLKNAVRDGAEWAWVPHGDTCPFCITLASNGWQKASSKVLKGGHADHIHANCDCEFAIRFDHNTTVAGYDPEKYLKQYRDAGGDINKMRRIDYAARKDAINAQKRAAYTLRTGSNSVPSVLKPFTVADCSVSTESYSFPDGYGGIMKTEDATVYTAPDNTKFVFPKKYDKSHQTMTPEQAVACWNKVPEGIRKQAQKEIVFVDYYNPADTYWQKVYKNFPHSYATGGDIITFYRYDVPHDMDYVVRTYCHEAGHYIDISLTNISGRYCTDSEWTKAMADDILVSKKKSPTSYGENSNSEDFAESIAEYIQNSLSFKQQFPNRTALIEKFIKV